MIDFVKGVWADTLYFVILGAFILWMITPLVDFLKDFKETR